MMSVPRSALHSKVRKAVSDQRQSASYRFMPELRPVETTGIPLYGHPAGCCSGTFRLLSAAFLSGPTASWANGDTFCLCRPSCLRHVTGRKSPHFVCPADRFFYPPKPSFITFINIPLYMGQFCLLYLYRDYLLSSYLACRRVGFIRCECRLSRLILPF